jgi:hypothetical protein
VSGWTPPFADAGRSFTFTVQASNCAGSNVQTWQVLVPVPSSCSVVKFTGFEGYANGTSVMFNLPRFSGSTSANLATSPNVAQVTDSVPAFSGTKCLTVQWAFVDGGLQRWLRLTASGGPLIPNPTMQLDRPIRVRLRLDSGHLRLCMGVRETGTTAEIGADGGASGLIEFVGASTTVSGAPQGVLIEPMPGVWQTFVFDPRYDPITPLNGDGVLHTATNKGVFENLSLSAVDSAGPFTVYLDDIEQLCAIPGDFNYDSHVGTSDFQQFESCLSGPLIPHDGSRLCRQADLDGDGDVDQDDFGGFQRCYSGDGIASDPYCAD